PVLAALGGREGGDGDVAAARGRRVDAVRRRALHRPDRLDDRVAGAAIGGDDAVGPAGDGAPGRDGDVAARRTAGDAVVGRADHLRAGVQRLDQHVAGAGGGPDDAARRAGDDHRAVDADVDVARAAAGDRRLDAGGAGAGDVGVVVDGVVAG